MYTVTECLPKSTVVVSWYKIWDGNNMYLHQLKKKVHFDKYNGKTMVFMEALWGITQRYEGTISI